MRHAPHVADPPLRVPTAQTDDAGKNPSQRAGAREPVVVDAEPQIAVRARGVGGEQAAVDVAHRLGLLGGAERMPVLFELPRAIAQRRRAPELLSRLGAAQRDTQQRVDARQFELRRIERRRPPDVRARLKHDRGRIARIARGERRKVGRGALEIAAIERIQPRAQRRDGRALQQENEREQHLHVSAER